MMTTCRQGLGLLQVVMWILSVTTRIHHDVSASASASVSSIFASRNTKANGRCFTFTPPQSQRRHVQVPALLSSYRHRHHRRRRRLLWGNALLLDTRGGGGSNGRSDDDDNDKGVTTEDTDRDSISKKNISLNQNQNENSNNNNATISTASSSKSSSSKREVVETSEEDTQAPVELPPPPAPPAPHPPAAIVETTTTTILEQSEFSVFPTTKENNKDNDMDEKIDLSTSTSTSTRSANANTHVEDSIIDGANDNEETVVVMDYEEETEMSTTRLSLEEVRDQAASLRLEGKELHDAGDFVEAADCFGSAADLILLVNDDNDDKEKKVEKDTSSDSGSDEKYELAEHFATLRLHEALCRLKAKDYEAAADACTQVLEGSGSSSSGSNINNDGSSNQGSTDNGGGNIHLSSAVRARALFRRAKARMEMDMMDEALQDARVAAFLGDRKAVALYGQLMRENSSSSSLSSLSSMFSEHPPLSPSDDGTGAGAGSRSSSRMAAASASSLLESLLDKSAAGTNAGARNGNINGNGNGGAPPFSPFGDLMGANSAAASGMGAGTASNSGNDFNPFSLLGALPAANGGADGAPGGAGPLGGGLAKSVLSSLSKRLDDESTHESICSFLQQASGPQLQQYASLAGVQLPDTQANKIASFAKGITPRGLKRTVKTSRRLIYAVQLMRKTMAVLNKYKMVIFVIVLLTWIKSAILRPIPINKRLARKAARQAAKAAAATAAI